MYVLAWVKLHYGSCETCQTDCSRDYRPICVQRNGVNYTMVNECYYNMGICMDKRSSKFLNANKHIEILKDFTFSEWKRIANGECKRFTRYPDKYDNIKPGFQFTSNYFVTSTTPILTPSTSVTFTMTTTNEATTTKTTTTKATPTTETTTKSTPTKVVTKAQSSKRSRKRIVSLNRNVARRPRPTISSKHIETMDYIMNLTKRKSM